MGGGYELSCPIKIVQWKFKQDGPRKLNIGSSPSLKTQQGVTCSGLHCRHGLHFLDVILRVEMLLHLLIVL